MTEDPRAFRAWVRANHPDRGGDPEAFAEGLRRRRGGTGGGTGGTGGTDSNGSTGGTGETGGAPGAGDAGGTGHTAPAADRPAATAVHRSARGPVGWIVDRIRRSRRGRALRRRLR
ncbi:hypothetical protein GCM10027570_39350 [Streptomonospora sediminis]